MTPIEHKAVKSSNVESVGYDEATKTLEVRYKSGGAPYRYAEVPPEKFAALMEAESVGSYLHKHIKPGHTCTRCEEEEKASA